MRQFNEDSLFDNRFILNKLLDRGGFSEVWLVEDTKVRNKKMALKVYAPGMGLDDDGVQLFSSEFEIVFDLNHSHLLRPAYFDVCDRSPYLLMPYCERGSAGKLIGCITEDEAWHFLHDVASGLEYLHAQNPPIIHQDVKPQNVLIDNLGRYLITDFGISAKARSTLRKSVGNAKSSGTVAYMPPERFETKNTPVKASDIWSLGATLYELLEGDVPFMDIIGGRDQLNGAKIPELTGDWSPTLKKIVTLCLQKETWDRPSAAQLVEWTDRHFRGEKITISNAKKEEELPNERRTQRRDKAPSPSPLEEKTKKKPVVKNILVAASVVIGIPLLAFWGIGIWQSDDSDLNAQMEEQLHQKDAVQPHPVNKTSATAKIDIEMVSVRGGTFTMGSEPMFDNYADERPAHRVTVSDFHIGKYPVTQAQWKAVMGSYPSGLHNTGCDDCPVENVNWNDVQEFIKKLNAQTGKTYRLPTEAEWEYAARGGVQSKGYKYSGSRNLDEVAWYDGNYKNSKHGDQGTTHPVGKKKPNELGIYDMSGNIQEWCQDWYDKDYYSDSPSNNPKGPSSGSYRVLRGGSWYYSARSCRVSHRSSYPPGGHRDKFSGFRLASVP